MQNKEQGFSYATEISPRDVHSTVLTANNAVLYSLLNNNDEGGRKLVNVMAMFMAQTVVMRSRIYTYLTHQAAPLNTHSFVYGNLTLIQDFLKNRIKGHDHLNRCKTSNWQNSTPIYSEQTRKKRDLALPEKGICGKPQLPSHPSAEGRCPLTWGTTGRPLSPLHSALRGARPARELQRTQTEGTRLERK